MMPPDNENPDGWIQTGRAYHSIWFEYLGELGYPGLFLFVLACASSMISLVRLSRKCRKIPDLVWVANMSDALQSGMVVFFTAGSFVGIGFQPPFWYLVAMGVSLRAYVYRAERADVTRLSGWRQRAQQTREATISNPLGWDRPTASSEPGALPARSWRGRPGAG